MAMSEPILPRKWTLRAHGQRLVFIKGQNESARHVIMKAMLWALYLPQYPTMTVEIRIGDRYKPDLVAFDAQTSIYAADKPLFWGESGVVGLEKIQSIVRRYPDTHFALAKWHTSLNAHLRMVREALEGLERSAPFDLLCIPSDSVERFIDRDGQVRITHEALEWVRLFPDQAR
jgi:hypothetical protein